jgi:thioesterase domain-containing protein
MNLPEVTAYLHEHIPITAHLGARVESYDGTSVCLSAPLEPNLNHQLTAFGGSVSALAILSGWTLLHLRLREQGIRSRLVIQKSAVDFLDPIERDFRAIGTMPPAEKWEKFLRTLQKFGRARISVLSRIESSAGTGGRHEGVYVAVSLREGEIV